MNQHRLTQIAVAAALTAGCSLLTLSCKEEKFLNVSDPNVLSVTTFPVKVEDLDLMVIDLYGRLRTGFYNGDNFRCSGVLPDHTADMGYNGANFPEFAELRTLPSDGKLGAIWQNHYENITRTNSFLTELEKIRKGVTDAGQLTRLKELEGEGRFLRAVNYFTLINLFGETMITSEADRAKMGIPLNDQVATDLSQTARERATVGQVWDFIIADLKKADELLTGKVWDEANKPRVNEWAVKSLLGKSYVFTQQWALARDVLKTVIDKSGKQLVDYATYAKMFNGQNEFNRESIFEINFTADRRDVWNSTLNTSSQYGIFISPAYLEDDGVAEGTNGFGNLFIHDLNNDRFGFTDTTASTAGMKSVAYQTKSLALRATKQIDPRLTVGTLQPWVDTIFLYNKWRKVTKARGEGFPLAQNQAWNHRKYVIIDRGLWGGEPAESIATNFYLLRLADVYLLYAEALQRTGNVAGALEYVNKVHRRAYNVPVDVASTFDYKSLTDKTKALGADDHLASDPLKYERWAELFAEGQWWFDVCRWKIGPQEQAYYKRVKSGQITWNERKYAFPIPESEMISNAKIKQNPGY